MEIFPNSCTPSTSWEVMLRLADCLIAAMSGHVAWASAKAAADGAGWLVHTLHPVWGRWGWYWVQCREGVSHHDGDAWHVGYVSGELGNVCMPNGAAAVLSTVVKSCEGLSAEVCGPCAAGGRNGNGGWCCRLPAAYKASVQSRVFLLCRR